MQENPWHIRRLPFWKQRAFSDLEHLHSLVRLSRPESDVTENEPEIWQRSELTWADQYPEEIARVERQRLLKTVQDFIKTRSENDVVDRFQKAGQLYASTVFLKAPSPRDAFSALFSTPVIRRFEFSFSTPAWVEEIRKQHCRWVWANAPEKQQELTAYMSWIDGFLSGVGIVSDSRIDPKKHSSGGVVVHAQWTLN